MPELTQSDYEAAEVRVHQLRERFLDIVCSHPEAFEAWSAWRQAEHALFDARRARRESEVHEG